MHANEIRELREEIAKLRERVAVLESEQKVKPIFPPNVLPGLPAQSPPAYVQPRQVPGTAAPWQRPPEVWCGTATTGQLAQS